MAIGVSADNHTHGFIRDSGLFAVSILSRSVDPELIRIFGYNSGRDMDKFAETAWGKRGQVNNVQKPFINGKSVVMPRFGSGWEVDIGWKKRVGRSRMEKKGGKVS